ncbi:LOW QUALITY PROTEIN: hypothetical protein KUTG_09548, partial [Kutzneria sp. 744]
MIYTVDLPGPGRLSTMAKPRLKDLPTLRAAGVDILVCALTDEDFADAGLTDEPKAAVDAGLDVVHLPCRDRTVATVTRSCRPCGSRRAPRLRRRHRHALLGRHRPLLAAGGVDHGAAWPRSRRRLGPDHPGPRPPGARHRAAAGVGQNLEFV